MTRSIFWSMTVALSLLLAGCGFELRGFEPSTAHPMPFTSLYIDSTLPVANELITRLKLDPRIKLASSAKDADAMLRITSETRYKDILTIDRSGQTAEYRLNYAVEAQMFLHGEAIGAPIVLKQFRTMTYNDNSVLGKGQEEDLLWTDMQRDVAQLLLYRMSSGQMINAAASASAGVSPVKATDAGNHP